MVICAWCEAEAVDEVLIAEPRFGTRRGRKVLVSASISVPACAAHADAVRQGRMDGEQTVARRSGVIEGQMKFGDAA